MQSGKKDQGGRKITAALIGNDSLTETQLMFGFSLKGVNAGLLIINGLEFQLQINGFIQV